MCDSHAMNTCHSDCESPMLIELGNYATCVVLFYYILLYLLSNPWIILSLPNIFNAETYDKMLLKSQVILKDNWTCQVKFWHKLGALKNILDVKSEVLYPDHNINLLNKLI